MGERKNHFKFKFSKQDKMHQRMTTQTDILTNYSGAQTHSRKGYYPGFWISPCCGCLPLPECCSIAR